MLISLITLIKEHPTLAAEQLAVSAGEHNIKHVKPLMAIGPILYF